jgi:hypothetical protein
MADDGMKQLGRWTDTRRNLPRSLGLKYSPKLGPYPTSVAGQQSKLLDSTARSFH